MAAAILAGCKNPKERTGKAFMLREKKFFDSLNTKYVIDTILSEDDFENYVNRKIIYKREILIYSSLLRGEVNDDEAEKIGEQYFRKVVQNDASMYRYISVDYFAQETQGRANYFPNK
jgi:hypothetical protein